MNNEHKKITSHLIFNPARDLRGHVDGPPIDKEETQVQRGGAFSTDTSWKGAEIKAVSGPLTQSKANSESEY